MLDLGSIYFKFPINYHLAFILIVSTGEGEHEENKRERGVLMTKREKIELILSARPRLVHIIKCANDDQLDRLVDEVQKELDRELTEAAFT